VRPARPRTTPSVPLPPTLRGLVRGLCGAIVAAGLAYGAVSGQAEGRDDEARIREVLSTYVSAWREGDVDRLARVFAAEHGRVMWLSGDGADQALASMTFQEILDRGSRPNPEYGLEWDVLSLDVLDGQLAVAKLYISRGGGSYIDYLTLQRIAGEWRIVNKTFVSRRD
jgi:hypothetical protein